MKNLILLITALFIVCSCSAYKPCHVKKYHIDKGIKRAQSKPRNY